MRLPTFLLTIVLTSLPSESWGKPDTMCSSGISKDICIPDNYAKFQLPKKDDINKIGVSVIIDEVLKIDDDICSITFSSYLNVEWEDDRITVRKPANSTLAPVNIEFGDDLWFPNVFIYNLKTVEKQEVLSKLEGIWIDGKKKVLYSQSVHVTFICPMRFQKFPFDTQTCKFQVGSYSYNQKQMEFVSKDIGYLSPKKKNNIPLNYDIAIKPLNPEDQVFVAEDLGNFSLSGFEMVLSRYVSTYIFIYYIPSGLLVTVSWISFLIPKDAIVGRLLFLATLFLIQVNIFNTVTTNTPKAGGFTAIEAWLFICILFLFGSLIEYAAILLKNQKNEEMQKKENLEAEKSSDNEMATKNQLEQENLRMDKYSLIFFPVAFLIFNIFYWLCVLL